MLFRLYWLGSEHHSTRNAVSVNCNGIIIALFVFNILPSELNYMYLAITIRFYNYNKCTVREQVFMFWNGVTVDIHYNLFHFFFQFSKDMVFNAYSDFVNKFSVAMETAKQMAKHKQQFAEFLKVKLLIVIF